MISIPPWNFHDYDKQLDVDKHKIKSNNLVEKARKREIYFLNKVNEPFLYRGAIQPTPGRCSKYYDSFCSRK